jgi:hypothetical protein
MVELLEEFNAKLAAFDKTTMAEISAAITIVIALQEARETLERYA